MDRRYKLWKILNDIHGPSSTLNEEEKREARLVSQALQEGKNTEFWCYLKAEIDHRIRQEELRFLDRLAPSYDVYLQAYSRRQALIAVLAIPETANGEGG